MMFCLFFCMVLYLFSEILQNEIGAFGGNLPLATFGSERVKGIYGSSK